jgi:hypothetical protein
MCFGLSSKSNCLMLMAKFDIGVPIPWGRLQDVLVEEMIIYLFAQSFA